MLTTAPQTRQTRIRRELYAGDGERIVDLHRRIYGPEFGRNEEFVASVARGVEAAIADGWPAAAGGGVWLIDGEREPVGRQGLTDGRPGLRGCLGLTDEGGGVGRARWFVLDPSLRGRGLGRALVDEMIGQARASAMTRVELETFSALRAAAHLYRDAGFRLVWERERSDWGPAVTYQGYVLELR